MKHAGKEAIAELGPMLDQIRVRSLLRENSPGTFYLKSRAFLHFHEDPRGLFADVRLTDDFTRLPVNTEKQRDALVRRIDRVIAERQR